MAEPFEQQVLEAVLSALSVSQYFDGLDTWTATHVARRLGPRIAAAIVAANAVADSEALDSLEQSQKAALAALRGGDV